MLVPGHSHTKFLDGGFGSIRVVLIREELLTPLDHCNVTKLAFSSESVDYYWLQDVMDLKGLLKPHINPNFKGHSDPRCFVFREEADGVVRMRYKDCASGQAGWRGDPNNPGKGVEIMLSYPDVNVEVGVIPPQPAFEDKTVDDARKQIADLRSSHMQKDQRAADFLERIVEAQGTCS